MNSPTTLQGVMYGPSDGVRWADLITRSGVFTAGDVLRLPMTIGGRPKGAAGGVVSDLADVARSFAEATGVAQAAGVARPAKPFSLTRDVQLRGLLFTLGDDPRVRAFVDGMIGSLILQDSRDSGDWVQTVAAYIRRRGDKSLAAHDLGISRQTLCERLERIQRLLGIDLADPATRTSLHAAIMVIESWDPTVISADRAWSRSIHTPGACLRVVE